MLYRSRTKTNTIFLINLRGFSEITYGRDQKSKDISWLSSIATCDTFNKIEYSRRVDAGE